MIKLVRVRVRARVRIMVRVIETEGTFAITACLQ